MALGGELAGRIVNAVRFTVLERLARSRKDGSEARIEWRGGYVHKETAQHLRHVARFVLLVLERIGVDSGKAASSRLWLGRTRDERGHYVPAGRQLGLAAEVGVSVRQLERYTALLQAAGVWHVWQPMERDEGGKGPRAPSKLPEKLRGETYAYNHWQLVGPVPKQLRANLQRYYGKKSPPSDAPAAANTAAAGVDAPRGVSDADFGADLLALLRARPIAPTRPPPRPS